MKIALNLCWNGDMHTQNSDLEYAENIVKCNYFFVFSEEENCIINYLYLSIFSHNSSYLVLLLDL